MAGAPEQLRAVTYKHCTVSFGSFLDSVSFSYFLSEATGPREYPAGSEAVAGSRQLRRLSHPLFHPEEVWTAGEQQRQNRCGYSNGTSQSLW